MDHVLSELSAMTHLSWVALHSMAQTEGDLGRQLRGCLYNCHQRNPGGIFNYQNFNYQSCSLALWEGGARVGLSQRSFVHLTELEKN